MKFAVICECGHVAEPDSREPLDTSPEVVAAHVKRFCAKCGRSLADAVPLTSPPSVESASGPRTFQQLWQSRQDDADGETVEPVDPISAPPPESRGDQLPTASSGSRSLWDVMGGVGHSSPRHISAEADPVPSKPKGLWSVMSASESATVADARSTDDKLKPTNPDETNSAKLTPSFAPISRPTLLAAQFPSSPAARETTRHGEKLSPAFRAVDEEDDDVDAEWSGGALAALSLGIGAVVLAGLSLQSGWLMRFPSLITGVAALLLGLIAIGDVRRAGAR